MRAVSPPGALFFRGARSLLRCRNNTCALATTATSFGAHRFHKYLRLRAPCARPPRAHHRSPINTMPPSRASLLGALAASLSLAASVSAQPTPHPLTTASVNANGVFPWLSFTAASAPTGPNITAPRSECGVGAMMPWADKLYVITYLSVPNAGAGTGLYAVDENLEMEKLMSHSSVYANRMIIPAINSIVIGPYVIDGAGGITVINDLLNVRVGGMAEHLTDPTSAYFLGMDGPFWECNLLLLNCTQLFDLVVALDMPENQQPHFKAAHTMNGIVWVATNTFDEADGLGLSHGGRLATWDGNMSSPWTILETTGFVEVAGRKNFGRVVFAMGWDDASIILRIQDNGDASTPTYDSAPQTYRLPKASQAYNHLWTTEWPRLREVVTERYLLDAYGTFFEVAPALYGGALIGVRPISTHIRMYPDFAPFRGFLVLGTNDVSSIFDNNLVTGQSQSGLLFTHHEALWNMGKPKGWGGPWLNDLVSANTPSDPYLMTGYDHKMLHLRWDPPYNAEAANVSVEVDFTGSAGHRGANFYLEPWGEVLTLSLTVAKPYTYYVFPDGFSAHWVRFTASVDGNFTAFLHYT